MRIVLATDVTVRGGVDRYVTDLAIALTGQGQEVVVVLEQTTASALPAMIGELGLDVRFITQYHRRHAARRIEDASVGLLAELAPDGLHAACGSPFSCLGLREAAAERGVPVIITEQFVDDALALTDSECARLKSSYLRARHVIFVSEGNRATMRRVVGLHGVAHSVIPNGVDVQAIRLRVSRAPGRGRGVVVPAGSARVMAAGRLTPVKGMDVLVRAIADLPPSLVGRLDLYGEGPEQSNLRQLIGELGLAGRAALHPWLSDVVGQMATHNLLVLPSKAEGMPYVVLEAMAAGIPVAATAVAGTAEALAYGIAGVLVTEPGHAALSAAIRTALTHPDETERRRLQATHRVEKYYDVKLQMSRTVALWMTPQAPADPPRSRQTLKLGVDSSIVRSY
jgi:glycosyltransferase involved in cell wall biosynthesis